MPFPVLPFIGIASVVLLIIKRNNEDAQIRRGREAIKKVLRTKKDAPNAMWHPVLGRIDFKYGFHIRKKKGGTGYGIAHIVGSAADKLKEYNDGETGGKILYRAPEVIMRGKIEKSNDNRLRITHDGYYAIIAKKLDGRPSANWLFHAYDIAPHKSRKKRRKEKALIKSRSNLIAFATCR
ncbi:MAG: hypothetical protein LBM92_03010 [Opitutaceae bacterium]|jgi:hypothetical protein|nr:hypothetical protein [Opitutaceae bacterium]